MKTTKKKPAKKAKRKAQKPVDPKLVNLAVCRADYVIQQCTTAISIEKAVLATLEKFVRQQRPALVKFIITHTDPKDPVDIARRALVISKWLELKTRDYAKR